MFIKNNVINVVISLIALNLLYFTMETYLSVNLHTILTIVLFFINGFIFVDIIILYFKFEKYRKKVVNKLKVFRNSKYSTEKVVDYKMLYQLITYIEKELITKKEKNDYLAEENIVLKNKLNVTESLLNQKTEKLAKIYDNLKTQMEKTSLYGKEIAKIESIKENIIAIISHEIRSPLFASINYFDVLKSTIYDELDDTYKQIFNKVQNGLHEMNEKITEMIDIHKLDTEEYQIKFEKSDFIKFVQKLVSHFKLRTEGQRDLKFVKKFNIENAEAVFDRAIIKKIIDNLLSNSCRFTPDGGVIKIVVDIEKKKKRSFFYIAISDTGIGVEKSNLYRIFSKFYETETAGHSVLNHKSGKLDFGTKGLGVGLPIVKELIKLHGGEIWVESNGLSKGTTFKILIPYIEKEN